MPNGASLRSIRRPTGTDPKAIFTHCTNSESARGIAAMLKLFQSEPGVSVTAEDLGADPMLLNVRNGTVDLRTSRLREHALGDLLTEQAPVTYGSAARCPL